MKILSATLSSTQVDRENEQATVRALESMAAAIARQYVPFGRDHDPRIAPFGRIIAATVSRQGRYHILLGEVECWEPDDQVDRLAGDGRTIPSFDEPEGHFTVAYDRTTEIELGLPFLTELADLAEGGPPRYVAKKGLELPYGLLLTFGAYALGQLTDGFLARLGEDVYNKLKAALKRSTLHRHAAGRDRLLVAEFGLQVQGRLVALQIIVVNPTEQSIEEFFATGLPSAERIAADLLQRQIDVARVVVESSATGCRLLYSLNQSGVPSPMICVDANDLLGRGVSMSGIATEEEASNRDEA